MVQSTASESLITSPLLNLLARWFRSNQAFRSDTRKRHNFPVCVPRISPLRASLCNVLWWICSNWAASSLFRRGSNSGTMKRPLPSGLEDTGGELARHIRLLFPDNDPVFHKCPRLNSKDLIASRHQEGNLGKPKVFNGAIGKRQEFSGTGGCGLVRSCRRLSRRNGVTRLTVFANHP